uniref:ATP synthase complex subunit 8 n=1 Tax=Filhollianassa ceramica TaxID=2734693 RepID=A0A1B1VTY0_9EUCA|nr:ATP synthase F0 subunit 8 [Filhollianassa ceramica]ANW37026.1 ATP synthase F0 subunit 8 [Filhollianassa ceramica]
MPQMAPLMWLPLMLMIVLTFMIFMTMNYFFSFVKSDSKSVQKTELLEKTWQW